MSEPRAIRLRGVCVRADGTIILEDVSWEIEAGTCALVVGPSGSGKSQLLRLLNRLREKTSGHLEVLGRDIEDHPVGELRKRVGWVPQRPSLGDRTARAVLEVPVELGALSRAEMDARLPGCLQTAQLSEELLSRPVTRLSGGERHRLAIARALLLQPQILLLDEPTSALDGARAARLLEGLDAWRQESGATLIVVTHRVEDVRTLGGELLVLEAGRVARSGAALDLLDDTTDFDVLGLMTGRPMEATS